MTVTSSVGFAGNDSAASFSKGKELTYKPAVHFGIENDKPKKYQGVKPFSDFSSWIGMKKAGGLVRLLVLIGFMIWGRNDTAVQIPTKNKIQAAYEKLGKEHPEEVVWRVHYVKKNQGFQAIANSLSEASLEEVKKEGTIKEGYVYILDGNFKIQKYTQEAYLEKLMEHPVVHYLLLNRYYNWLRRNPEQIQAGANGEEPDWFKSFKHYAKSRGWDEGRLWRNN